MAIEKVLVTGSGGRIGREVVSQLRDSGYEVTGADLHPDRSRFRGSKVVNCEDLGQVIEIMQGHDAVIHLAAIPSPVMHTAEVVFRNNIITHFNILEAATILGIKNVVTASSLSALGYAFRHRHFNPVRIPIDETHPLLSQDTYGLSKTLGEELCEGFLRRTPDMALVSLRFTTVLDDSSRAYIERARQQDVGESLSGAFWTFVDVRDAALACRLSMAYNTPGHEAFYISAPHIYHEATVESLLAANYPGDYPVADHIRGHVSPVDCSKAERLLGWQAHYNWDGSPLAGA